MQTIATRFSLIAIFFLFAFNANAQIIFGLTNDGKIATFNANSPSVINNNVEIKGLNKGQKIIGIDTRPATGELYALGYNSTNDSASIYVINPMSGMATVKGSYVKLSGLGEQVGFDFNPTVDRIRLVSKTGKNYRLNPNNGAIAATDMPLNYASSDMNVGKTPNATACAYTNSYIAATSTQLFTYDEALGTLTFQNPPNDGILNTRTKINLAMPNTMFLDFDIYNNPSTFMSTAFAVLQTNLEFSLHTLNTTNGETTMIGNLAANVIDIAVAIDRVMPALKGNLAYGLTFTGGNSAFNLLTFDTQNPTFIRSARVISGIRRSQNLIGMDVRPQDGKIYVLGYRPTDSTATIYTLIDSTAMLNVYPGADSFKLALSGQTVFDFNPSANRLRIIGANNLNNYRLNLTVNPITVTLDTMITYKNTDVNAGKKPIVVTGAYTKSFNGSTGTQLYDIDAALNSFTNQRSANGGFLNTIGALGIMLDPNDYTSDLDIYTTTSNNMDTAYLSANVMGSNGFDNLYTIDISTGQAKLIDRIGLGLAIRNIAIKITPKTISSKEISQNLKAVIFPNPANQQLNVKFQQLSDSPVSLEVYNLQGQVLLQKNYASNGIDFFENLDISALDNGIYILKISNMENTRALKFVKE